MQRIRIDAAGENLARVWLHSVIGARQASNGVEQDDDVLLVLEHARGKFVRHRLEDDTLIRKERSQIVEMRLVLRLVRVFLADGLDFEEGEEPLFLFGWPDLTGDEIARLQIETANL